MSNPQKSTTQYKTKMFQKPPLRTYERKKAGVNASSILLNKIVRDLSPDRNMQPPIQIEACQDGDESMVDPFDTTFDRLLKAQTMPPRPAIEDSNGYDSSSSDAKSVHSDDDLPLVYEEPLKIQRRVFGGKKVVEGRLTKKSYKRRAKPAKKNNASDENADPNIEQASVDNNRGKTKAATSEKGSKNQRVAKKRTSVTEFRRNKNMSTSQTDDSINNTTQQSEFSSIAGHTSEENSSRLITEKKISTHKQETQRNDSESLTNISSDSTEQYEDLAIPGPSNASENYVKQFVTKRKTSTHRKESQNKSNERQTDVVDNSMQQYEDFAIPGPSNAGDDYVNKFITKRKTSTQREKIQKAEDEYQTDFFPNTTQQHEDFAIPSNAREANKERVTKEQDKTSKESANIPKIVIDTISTPTVENNPRPLKNLTVSLTRLNVPDSFSIANKSWKNSTPITQRPIRKKQVLRFSPIDKNKSANMRVRLGDEDSEEASLPSKSLAPTVNSFPAKSKSPESSHNLSENLKEQSTKRQRIFLSDSPATDPSALMFEESEVQEQPSSTSSETHAKHSNTAASPDEKLECKNTTEPSTITPFKGFSAATQAVHFVTVASSDDKLQCKNTTEASTMSPFKGFSMESSDPESFHLQYEGTDNTHSSPENLKETANKASRSLGMKKLSQASTNEENDGDTMEASTAADVTELTKDSSDAESICLTFNEDDEDEDSVSSSKEPPHITTDTLDDDTDEQFTGLPEHSHDYTTTASQKADSDDEWSTIASSQDIDDDTSKKRGFSVKISSKIPEPKRRQSIEQLSSDDNSNDDLSELIQANEISSSAMEVDSEWDEEERLEGQESAMVEDISGNESKAKKSSLSEKSYEKESGKDTRQNLLQPVVLLERLVLPVKQLEKMENVKNKRGRKTSAIVGSRGKSNEKKKSPDRKSRRLTDLKKRRTNTIDSSVSGDEVPVFKKKSRKLETAKKTASNVTKAPQVIEDLVLNPSAPAVESPVSVNTEIKTTLNPVKQKRKSVLSSSNNDPTSEEAIPVRKSRRMTKADKKSIENHCKTLQANQDSTMSSPEREVSESRCRKSRRFSKVMKTAQILSETRKATRDSTFNSPDQEDSARKPRKSGRLMKGRKITAQILPEILQPSQDSTLSSPDSDVSRSKSRKSVRFTKVKETAAENPPETMEASQDSSQSSSASIPDDQSPLVSRKSDGITSLSHSPRSHNSSIDHSPVNRVSINEKSVPPKSSRKTGAKYPSDILEASANSTLNSTEKSPVERVSINGKKVSAKKSRKTGVKYPSETHEASSNSALNPPDATISHFSSPDPPKKIRKLTLIDPDSSQSSKGSPDLTKNSTINSYDDSIFELETPIVGRKSRRISAKSKASPKNLFKTTPSSQNSTINSGNDIHNDKSQDSSSSTVEIKIPTDSIHDAITPIIRRKPRKLDSLDESQTNDSFETLELNINPQLPNVEMKNTIENKESQDDIESLVDDENREAIEPRETYLRRSKQPVVLLNRLNDAVRVSLRRRNKFSNLSVITENRGGKTTTIIEEDSEEPETPQNDLLTQIINERPERLTGEEVVSQQTTTASCGSSIFSNSCNRFDDKEDKLLFLKPGKSWTRSLSILSNVHSQEDVESLAVGKGKKWRESVNAILQMQQQGLLQSCVKKNENDKESRSVYGVRSSTAAWTSESSQSDTSRVFGTASPGRFVRRVSIRVVPDGKNLDNNEDTSFLEAYGISASQNRTTIGKRSTSLALRKTFVYNVQDVSYDNIPKSIDIGKSRDVVLQQCGQETHLPFDECYPPSYLKHCRKIGEGVYGEVFLYENGAEKTVIKIIPIEGEMNVNNERQKKFEEILSEIVIAKELHNLRFAESSRTHSFVEVKNIRCVIGKYPQKLIELWKIYDEEKKSENDCPDMFEKNQLYIVLELSHGGEDLEAFVFQNASETLALFMQTAVALAVAEEKLEFEHRDLHWGNILIARTDEPHVEFKLQDKPMKLVSKGVKVSVIDFTLSRMTYPGCSIFNDLSEDNDLFTAQGEYQFEIYRLMRDKVENDWRRFEPFTNVLWLHYTLDKMIKDARYRRKNSKIHTTSINKLQELKDTVLNYTSALDFVTNCDKVTLLQSRRASVTTVT